MSLDDLFSQIQAGNLKELNIIVKADVQGSVEAVKQSLLKLSNDEVVVKIIHGGVGAINESDVMLAALQRHHHRLQRSSGRDSQGHRRARRRRPPSVPRHLRRHRGCGGSHEGYAGSDLRGESYRPRRGSSDSSRLPESERSQDPMFWTAYSREAARFVSRREGNQIFEGALASLKTFQGRCQRSKAGYECGLVFERFNDLQEFDQVEAYIMVEVPR